MPKVPDPQSFDVAGTSFRQDEDPRSTLEQAFQDYRTPDPTRNFTHRTAGNRVTIACHCHERGLGDPARRAAQVNAMAKLMDDFVRGLKKRFRELGGGTLDMTEDKSGRGYDIQQVSMNDRWDIIYRRTYEVPDLISNPED